MKLVLSPAAIHDLQSIAEYTLRTWGPEQEHRYLEGLWARLEEIRAAPERFKPRPELGEDFQSARHEKHVVFFRIRKGSLQIIRILHTAMDFGGHLSEEPS